MGDLLTRVTIWLALALYAAAQLTRGRPARTSVTGLWLFALGCGFFIAHVILAFDVYYGWSHATAYAETAARTEALTGLRSGSGLYLNYLFGMVWVVEVEWWKRSEADYLCRPAWVELTVRSFFLFMIVNGAVVFVAGPQRWLGGAIVALLLVAWRPTRR